MINQRWRNALMLSAVALAIMSQAAWAACDDPPATGVEWNDCDKAGIDLAGADLSFSDIRRTNLEGANLAGVNLEGARLMRSNLLNADITGANFAGAHLSAVIWPDGRKCGWYSVGECTNN